MKIAVCQMNIAFEKKEENLNKICRFIFDAKEKNADIVFFPEMSLTGFSMNIKYTSEKNFENINTIKKCAKENNIYVGIGWVKPFLEKAENHYSIISNEGEIVCDYIKIHPFSYMQENQFFYGGEKVSYFKLCDMCFSTFICYDLRFPEIFQGVSYKSSVIVVAANWPESRREHWKCLLKARAIENQSYIIGVNCFGMQGDIYYAGDSCCFDPDGKIVFMADEKESLSVFHINNDVMEFRKNFPLKKDRKSYLYKKLI